MIERQFLIISEAIDVHADAVSWGLEKLGIGSTLLPLGQFPAELGLSLRIDSGVSVLGAAPSPILDNDSWLVWRRRVMRPRFHPRLHPADIEPAVLEARDFVGGMLRAMSGKSFKWINDNAAAVNANSKAWQLQSAAGLGLRVPKTLMSNDPREIRAFFAECGSRMISKSFYPRIWRSEERRKTYTAVTSLVKALDDMQDASLAACPTIYQALVPKAFEVRVTYFAGRISAVRIDSQAVRETIDWRYDTDGGKPWSLRPLTLPDSMVGLTNRLMRDLGLTFGCLDFIVTPDGEYVFLEVNEQGQFLWIEEQLPSERLLAWFCEGVSGALGRAATSDALREIDMERYLATPRYRTLREALNRDTSDNGLVAVE